MSAAPRMLSPGSKANGKARRTLVKACAPSPVDDVGVAFRKGAVLDLVGEDRAPGGHRSQDPAGQQDRRPLRRRSTAGHDGSALVGSPGGTSMPRARRRTCSDAAPAVIPMPARAAGAREVGDDRIHEALDAGLAGRRESLAQGAWLCHHGARHLCDRREDRRTARRGDLRRGTAGSAARRNRFRAAGLFDLEEATA